MKTPKSLAVLTALVGLVAAAGVGDALADTARTARSYKVKFTEVANSCDATGISLSNASLKIAPVGKKKSLMVTVPMVPVMSGSAGKKGKFSARAKKGKTAISGLDGKFSIAGDVDDSGKIEFIFIAEYYKGATPLCTTSWKGKGAPGEP